MGEKKEFGGWWLFILGLLVVSSIVFAGLRFAGVFGERIVFENSFQYHESRKSEMAVFESQLAEIESQLLTETDENIKSDLKAKKSAIKIQLSALRKK